MNTTTNPSTACSHCGVIFSGCNDTPCVIACHNASTSCDCGTVARFANSDRCIDCPAPGFELVAIVATLNASTAVAYGLRVHGRDCAAELIADYNDGSGRPSYRLIAEMVSA